MQSKSLLLRLFFIRNSVYSVELQRLKLAESVGLSYKIHDTRKQENALAVAQTALLYPAEEELLRVRMRVSRSTFFEYYRVARDNQGIKQERIRQAA